MADPIVARLLNKLKGLKNKAGGEGWIARCPAHDDHSPSLSVDFRDGKVLVSCFTGCTADAVIAAVGLSWADLHDDSPISATPLLFQKPPKAPPVAIYQYRNHEGIVVAEKGRFELPDGKKSFLWRAYGDTGWSGLSLAGIALTDLALWGSEQLELHPNETAFFVEGEKSASACSEAGLLAVTFAGGASTKDFGKSLEVLRGRDVALWPDNDAAGREYMSVVEARLRGVAANIRLVNVPLPLKGDAVEYFAEGGAAADLLTGAMPLTGPQLDFLTTDSLRVTVPFVGGVIVGTFNEIEKSQRSLDAEMVIEVQAPGFSTEPYTERINLSSISARETLRRDLDNVYGKTLGWTKLLNTMFGLVRSGFLSQDLSKDLTEIEDGRGDLFFLEPFLPADAMTIMFGNGESLKSFTAFQIAYCVSMGLPFFGYYAPRVPVLIVDYEDNEQNFLRRMRRIALGHQHYELEPNAIRYFPAKGVPLRDLAFTIREVIRKFGIGLVIIDSVGPATGGKPEDSDSCLAYARAVQKIGATSLHLAHVTKASAPHDQVDFPYGNIFWHNEARRTWYVAREQEEESDDVELGLYCKKVNDGARPKTIAAKVHFEGLHGAVTMTVGTLADNPTIDRRRDLHYRIRDYLRTLPLGVAMAEDIAEYLGEKKGSVQMSIDRHPGMFLNAGNAKSTSGRRVATYGLRKANANATSDGTN